MNKKILYFVTPLKFFCSHRLPIAIKAKELGYDVHILSGKSEQKYVDLIKSKGIEFHKMRLSRGGTNIFQELITLYDIIKMYIIVKPDIVHHVTIKPLLYGTLAARLSGVHAVINAFSGLGHVFTDRGTNKGGLKKLLVLTLYRLIFRHKNMIHIFQNNDDVEVMASNRIVDRKQVVLIKGSGVDLNEFSYSSEPKELPPVVMLPARLLKDKGVVEFVDAAKILKAENVAVRMVLVGEIDEGNPSAVSNTELESWVDNKLVEAWGYQNQMSKVLQQANIVCLPSYREGLPKSLIEACAIGRAIITTDVPGCREVISKNSSEVNGLLIPPHSGEEIAKAIKVLIRDEKLRSKMAFNSRKKAEADFSIESVVNHTIDIYDRI